MREKHNGHYILKVQMGGSHFARIDKVKEGEQKSEWIFWIKGEPIRMNCSLDFKDIETEEESIGFALKNIRRALLTLSVSQILCGIAIIALSISAMLR